jgi:aryl-alcohol dehydrogenase-like predicted oxidoreductase
VVLATKYTLNAPGIDPNAAGNQRKNMFAAVDASLKRLKTDYIDLYWLHIWDQITPVEEVMRGFEDLVRQGKILYCGVSDAPAWWVSRANTIADFRGWSAFVALQIEWNLIERTVERELIPMARAMNLAITPWSPLASGVLTGKHTNRDGTPKKPAEPSRMNTEMAEAFGQITPQKHKVAAAVLQIAQETGHSPAQVALNWLRRQNTPTAPVIPIIGARKFSQFQDNLDCLKWELSDEHFKRLNEVSAIEPGFPNEFYARDTVRNFVYGGTRDRIDV